MAEWCGCTSCVTDYSGRCGHVWCDRCVLLGSLILLLPVKSLPWELGEMVTAISPAAMLNAKALDVSGKSVCAREPAPQPLETNKFLVPQMC